MTSKCCFCTAPVGSTHEVTCIYATGFDHRQLVTEAHANRPLPGMRSQNSPEAVAARAKIVREALQSLSNEPGVGHYFTLLAQGASEETLAKLGRLLRG